MALLDFLRRRSPEDDYAQRLIRRLQQRGWPHRLEYLSDRFSIVTDDKGATLYLGNLFQDWRTRPRREQSAQLDRAIALVVEGSAEETYEEVAQKLLPVIRNLTHLQGTALDAPEAPSTEIWQPFRRLVGPLAVVLAVDLPTSISLVPHSRIEAWGHSFDDLLDRAIENLVAMSPVCFELTEGRFYVSTYGDAHDSSRILMPELFRALPLNGDPVAVVVSRTCIAVAGSMDVDALDAMAAFVVASVAEEVRPTSYIPLVLKGSEWTVFEPSDPQLASISELNLRQTVWDYGVQTPVLEGYLDGLDLDVFVAPLHVTDDEGRPATWTSWTENVPARLPRAQAIGLTDARGAQLIRMWGDVETVCGSFGEDTSLYPSRFTPGAWPSKEAWERLRTEYSAPGWGPDLDSR